MAAPKIDNNRILMKRATKNENEHHAPRVYASSGTGGEAGRHILYGDFGHFGLLENAPRAKNIFVDKVISQSTNI